MHGLRRCRRHLHQPHYHEQTSSPKLGKPDHARDLSQASTPRSPKRSRSRWASAGELISQVTCYIMLMRFPLIIVVRKRATNHSWSRLVSLDQDLRFRRKHQHKHWHRAPQWVQPAESLLRPHDQRMGLRHCLFHRRRAIVRALPLQPMDWCLPVRSPAQRLRLLGRSIYKTRMESVAHFIKRHPTSHCVRRKSLYQHRLP